jgi:hypothetical protein
MAFRNDMTAMYAMHDALRRELGQIARVTARPDDDPKRVLRTEEADGLPLIDATVTEEQWQAFGAEGGRRIAGDVWRYVPWMLEGATPEVTAAVLGRFPAPLQQAYRDEWQPAYAKLTLWP